MKQFLAALLISLSSTLVSSEVHAQPTKEGPAYMGVFEGVVGGNRISLERLAGNFAARTRNRFIGGMESGYDFEGRSSPVRFRQGDDFFFIVRALDSNIDPYTYFLMSSMKQHKKSRMIPISRTGSILQSSGPVRKSEFQITLVFEPYKKDFIKIRPATDLPPGEYMLGSGALLNGFGFGVD